jgi:hypothetical protein
MAVGFLFSDSANWSKGTGAEGTEAAAGVSREGAAIMVIE